MKQFVTKVVFVSGLIVLTIGYLNFADQFIQRRFLLLTNVIVMPMCVGVATFFFFEKQLLKLAPWVILIPIAHVLYFADDTAKPGLGNVFAIIELGFIFLGAILSALVMRLTSSSIQDEKQ